MEIIPPYVSALLRVGSPYSSAVYRWNANSAVGTGVSLSYAFPSSVPGYYAEGSISYFSALDTVHQDAVRTALAQISCICNITFTEVSDPNASDLTFAGDSYFHTGFPYFQGSPGSMVPTHQSGDVFLVNAGPHSPTTEAPTAGSYSYFSILREIGIALGLKYSLDVTSTLASAGLPDDRRWSMMSVNSVPNSNVQSVTERTVRMMELFSSTPMIYDIATLQYLYGANTSYHTGDDTYTWAANSAFYQTIWDAGGRNTIDVSNYTLSCNINLNPGTLSSIGIRRTIDDLLMDVPSWYRDYLKSIPGRVEAYKFYNATGNLGIAYGTTIQVAIGGSAADVILGNSVANLLEGRGGNDTLTGGEGADTLTGGTGADVFLYQNWSESTLGGYDVITDFTAGDKLSFAGVTGMRLRGTAYTFTSSVSATCAAIDADDTISNQFVTFTTGGSCYVYAKGAGTGGTSYNGTLISLTGVSSLGAGSFVGVPSTRPAAFDLAGNGKSVVIWNTTTTGDVGYWSISGDTPSWNYLRRASTTMRVAGTGDFNGDGTIDLLWQNPTNNYVGMWAMNNGAATWSPIFTGSTTMQIAGIGDFNGDGTADILWQNPTNNFVGMWAMHNGAASWQSIYTGSTTMQIAGIGDFNGDGTSDILWQNPTNNFVGMWAMHNGVASWQSIFTGSTTMQVAGIGDFNGDGTSDILWQNPTNNYVGLWTMNNGVASWQAVGNGSSTMQIASIGDYNGDGTSDILWRNSSNGAVGVWQMNNGTPTWALLGASPTDYDAVKV